MEYDVFISYRRSSYDTANLIATRLKAAGYSVFIDMETLRAGKFNEQLFNVIDNCKDLSLCFHRRLWTVVSKGKLTLTGKGTNIVALFVDSSNCRWVVQELKNARDVNRLVSNFISAHPDLKDELEKKSNFFEVLKKPFSSLTISNIWVHWVIFAEQPIWYVCYNNWPKIWSIILSLNAVILLYVLLTLVSTLAVIE